MSKEYWITDSRFKYIGLILLIMFLVFFTFLYLKADEITKDPCFACAKRMGDTVKCTTGGYQPIFREYYPNDSMRQWEP